MSYRPLPLITEDLDELQQRLRASRKASDTVRLHMLVLIKSGQVASRKEAAERLAVHNTSVRRWVNCYERSGLEGLLQLKKRGPKSGQRTVDEAVYEALDRRLDDRAGFASYIEVQQWLYDQFDLRIPYKSVYNLVRYHMKAKLKRPRPVHPKKTSVKPSVF